MDWREPPDTNRPQLKILSHGTKRTVAELIKRKNKLLTWQPTCTLDVLFFRCLVKLYGGMMISFPAGIVRVLAENPAPAVLSFRVKNIQKIDTINVNSQLVAE
jgi:hypothetical protein